MRSHPVFSTASKITILSIFQCGRRPKPPSRTNLTEKIRKPHHEPHYLVKKAVLTKKILRQSQIAQVKNNISRLDAAVFIAGGVRNADDHGNEMREAHKKEIEIIRRLDAAVFIAGVNAKHNAK